MDAGGDTELTTGGAHNTTFKYSSKFRNVCDFFGHIFKHPLYSTFMVQSPNLFVRDRVLVVFTYIVQSQI